MVILIMVIDIITKFNGNFRIRVRTTFGGSDVENVHAVVARSTFPSQSVQSTPAPDHFSQLRCRKSARRCGAKHISKSKTPGVRTIFGGSDVEKAHTVVARSTCRSQNVKNTRGSDHFWRFRCRKSACRCGAKHISKSKCTKHTRSGPLLAVEMYTTGYYTTQHSSTLHYTTLHSSTLHYTKLHYTTIHYTTLHYTLSHYTTLHSTTLHYTILHYPPLHFTTLHYTTLHYTTTTTTLHYTPLHSITLHYTPLH